MNTQIFCFARVTLAAICSLAALAGVDLAMQAYDFLVEAFRFNAVLLVGAVSAALFIASGLLAFGRRSGLLVTLASGASMLALVVFGLFHMGDTSLYEAFKQASCMSGYAVCFNQAATVFQLCGALVLGGIALTACRYFAPKL